MLHKNTKSIIPYLLKRLINSRHFYLWDYEGNMLDTSEDIIEYFMHRHSRECGGKNLNLRVYRHGKDGFLKAVSFPVAIIRSEKCVVADDSKPIIYHGYGYFGKMNESIPIKFEDSHKKVWMNLLKAIDKQTD